MDPVQFFEKILPALARGRAVDFPALAAPAIISVGAQAWTCTLHDDAQPVKRGVDRALLEAAPAVDKRVTTRRSKKKPAAGPALSLWLDEATFQSLLDGTLDERRVGYRGDLRWLAQLGRMLAGSGGAVDVRGGD